MNPFFNVTPCLVTSILQRCHLYGVTLLYGVTVSYGVTFFNGVTLFYGVTLLHGVTFHVTFHVESQFMRSHSIPWSPLNWLLCSKMWLLCIMRLLCIMWLLYMWLFSYFIETALYKTPFLLWLLWILCLLSYCDFFVIWFKSFV